MTTKIIVNKVIEKHIETFQHHLENHYIISVDNVATVTICILSLNYSYHVSCIMPHAMYLGRSIRCLLSKLGVHVVHVFPLSGCFLKIKCMRERREKEGEREREKEKEKQFDKSLFFSSPRGVPQRHSAEYFSNFIA